MVKECDVGMESSALGTIILRFLMLNFASISDSYGYEKFVIFKGGG